MTLCGVIEGFYGCPWTRTQRLELFEWMSEWGLNTYVYAPKDELKARAAWRELYRGGELDDLRTLVSRCKERGIAFVYALSPGLDIRYADPQELQALQVKLEQLMGAGVDHFCVLFDDIPTEIAPPTLHNSPRSRRRKPTCRTRFLRTSVSGWTVCFSSARPSTARA